MRQNLLTTVLVLECIVFQLLRRGCDVSIGEVGSKEENFIDANAEQKRYIQMIEFMNEPITYERKLGLLRRIRGNAKEIRLR